MKKGIVAIVVISLLLVATIVNTNYLEKNINDITKILAVSKDAADSGDFITAVHVAEEAEKKWKDLDNYVQSFVRDNGIDSATDGFYELLRYLYSKDKDSAKGAYANLIINLQGIADAEKITFSNIF